ncbi:unnamed protein product [Psylliodes chrysocephalus]|uniref:Uncharacterized protein n=1 Tax=Psylliodes chrysocephalus TaxID=3402493 RepID=A0A9P0CHK4_9CUCU|nr:unnamed protein product [Psylliodes chrysocephala]
MKNVESRLKNLQTYDLQTAFLSSFIKKVQPKRRKTDAAKEKHYSTVITLLGKRVYKRYFLSTFDISLRRFQVQKRGMKELPNGRNGGDLKPHPTTFDDRECGKKDTI